MQELALQKFVCDVVNDAGGYAQKRTSAFLVGISDLLVKLPPRAQAPLRGAFHNDFPAGIIEVKQRAYPATDRHFKLDITGPQKLDLMRADRAGMPTGVLSFLQKGSGSGLVLYAHLMTYRTASYADNLGIEAWTTHRRAHVELGRKGQREGNMQSLLHNWQKEWRGGR